MDGPILFGSVAKVNEYKRQQGIEITSGHEDKPTTTTIGGEFSIGESKKNDAGDIIVTDEEIAILNKVLLKSDPDDVYMQEDITFYDSYYLNNSKKLDEDIVKEVRKIRRLYKDYSKYLYACHVREKYLDMLDETYGADSELRFFNIGTKIPDDVFIPPNPMYSRNAPDYDAVMAGIINTELPINPPTGEELSEFLRILADEEGIDINDVGISWDYLTDRVADIAHADKMSLDSKNKRFSGPSVNVTDLDNLQRLIKSWHKKEDDKAANNRNIPFPESEAGRRYLMQNDVAFYIIDYINNNMDEQKVDENELVYDEKTKKTMTRKEYNQRSVLRYMSEEGGWDFVKLMSQTKVGSKLERAKLKNKISRRKKLKKKAANFMSDITGDNVYSGDYVTEDELRKYLFDD